MLPPENLRPAETPTEETARFTARRMSSVADPCYFFKSNDGEKYTKYYTLIAVIQLVSRLFSVIGSISLHDIPAPAFGT